MASITVDATQMPVLSIVFDGTVDDDAFDRYLADIHALSQRRGRGDVFAMVIDSRNGGRPSPSQRHRQTEFIKTHNDELGKRCVGAAFVITSAVQRGVLTALLWVQPMPYPHVVVATVAEAQAWCRQQVAARSKG